MKINKHGSSTNKARATHWRVWYPHGDYGDLRYKKALNEAEVRTEYRDAYYDGGRLPPGYSFEPVTSQMEEEQRRFYEEDRKSLKGTGLCVTDF